MKFIVAAASCLTIAVTPAVAADSQVESAVKTMQAIESSPSQLADYCDFDRARMDAALYAIASAFGGDDEQAEFKRKNEILDKAISDSMQVLGPDFAAAWALYEKIDPKSADRKALSDAVNGLDARCRAIRASRQGGQEAPLIVPDTGGPARRA